MLRAASVDRLLAILIALAGVVGLIVAARLSNKEPAAETQEAGKGAKRSGQSIKLGRELAESYGIEVRPARPIRFQPRSEIYGRVVSNPQAATEIRSPVAGILKSDRKQWLQIGQKIGPQETVGLVLARISPQEQFDFQSKAIEAEEKAKGFEEAFAIHEERVRRLEKIGDTVARAEVDQARIQIAEAKAQLLASRGQARLWREATKSADASSIGFPLVTPSGGEVAELLIHPGTPVEAGATVAKIIDYTKVLIRLDFEVGQETPDAMVVTATAATTNAVQSLRVKHVGLASGIDPASQYVGQLYEATAGNSTIWRPGFFVKGRIGDAGPSREAVATSPTALLYHMGRPLVYVQVAPGRFERRDVEVCSIDGAVMILGRGVMAGEEVVVKHAQTLLSEEFRGQADDD